MFKEECLVYFFSSNFQRTLFGDNICSYETWNQICDIALVVHGCFYNIRVNLWWLWVRRRKKFERIRKSWLLCVEVMNLLRFLLKLYQCQNEVEERHYQSLIKINLSCFFVDTSSSVCLTTDCIETGKC